MKNLVGPRIRELRYRRGKTVTQAQLAARLQTQGLDIDRSAISRIELGQRSVTDIELVGIAKALGLTVGTLFGKEES